MAGLGPGCVKTQAFNLRIENLLDFVSLKMNGVVAAVGKRAIEKTIFRLVSC
jgi:hypothetical protein